jgi:hypothetical protein
MPSSPGLGTRQSADTAPFDSNSCGDGTLGTRTWSRAAGVRQTVALAGRCRRRSGSPLSGLLGEGYGVAAVWASWGGAGGVGTRRQRKVGEDGAHDRRILDGGDDAQPAATTGTGEDIEIERTAHQRRPGPGVRGEGRAGLGREGGGVWGRAAVADEPVTFSAEAVSALRGHRDPREGNGRYHVRVTNPVADSNPC